MSTFLETLFSYQLANLPALSAVIGDRLYPVLAPQGVELPFAVCTQISLNQTLSHGGSTDWGETRIQYEFFAYTFHEVVDAAEALRSAFEGNSITLAAGVLAAYCEVEAEFDDYDSDEKIYRRSIDLLLRYKKTN